MSRPGALEDDVALSFDPVDLGLADPGRDVERGCGCWDLALNSLSPILYMGGNLISSLDCFGDGGFELADELEYDLDLRTEVGGGRWK